MPDERFTVPMTSTENSKNERWLTAPNVITSIRIVGSPLLILVASLGQVTMLIALGVFLVFTEWLDGQLARRLHVASAIGARLDTIADAVFYSCLLIALARLRSDLVAAEAYWIMPAIGSYAISWIVSLAKFRRLPSYHTWAAKGVWLFVGAGIACLLLGFGAMPFRFAMICVSVANLEAICVTLVLADCQTDVPSLWHAIRKRKQPVDDALET